MPLIPSTDTRSYLRRFPMSEALLMKLKNVVNIIGSAAKVLPKRTVNQQYTADGFTRGLLAISHHDFDILQIDQKHDGRKEWLVFNYVLCNAHQSKSDSDFNLCRVSQMIYGLGYFSVRFRFYHIFFYSQINDI